MLPDWKDTHHVIDLTRLTLADEDIRARLRSGELRKLTAEIAVPADYYRQLPPWEKAEARAAAVGLTADKAVVSGMATARLQGIRLLGVEERVDLQLPGDSRPGAKSTWMTGARYRSTYLPDNHVRVHRGIRVTTIVRTLADIARFAGHTEAVAAIDSARRRWRQCTPAFMEERVEEMGAFPGVRGFRKALGASRPGIDSPWETKARLTLESAEGIRRLETQVPRPA